MNKLEFWFLKRIIAREVQQGPNHESNLRNLYAMIRSACQDEFTEDNCFTIDAFQREVFESTQFRPIKQEPEVVNYGVKNGL